LLRNSFRYAARQGGEKIAKALKPVCAATNENAAAYDYGNGDPVNCADLKGQCPGWSSHPVASAVCIAATYGTEAFITAAGDSACVVYAIGPTGEVHRSTSASRVGDFEPCGCRFIIRPGQATCWYS
jgi:hypothetical protein